MITYFLALIATWLLNLISYIFGFLLGWLFPPGVSQVIAWLFSPLKYFGWFIDLHFLGSMIFYLFGFLTVWWGYRILRFAFSAIVGLFHGVAVLEDPALH